MLGRRLVAALSFSLVSRLVVLLLGCPFALFCCHLDVCYLCRLGNRLRPCWVSCRRRSYTWGPFSFCRILYPRCGSRSRALSVPPVSLIRSVWSLIHQPSCWLVLTACECLDLHLPELLFEVD